MSTNITPALTAEEWNAPQVRRTDRHGNVTVIERDRAADGETLPVEQAGGRAHALAAIGLHGKSFGFTQDHLDVLGTIRADYAAILSESSGLHASSAIKLLAALDAVIARVQALLPPR